MKKAVKLWLIIGSLFIVSGVIVFTVAIMINGGVNMAKYRTETYTELENFSDIYISVDTANVTFVKSTEEKAKVVCYENEKTPHVVAVQNGKLSIENVDNRKWYEYINFSFKTTKITVYLPSAQYGTLYIESSTGDVTVSKDFSFEKVEINGSTGDIEFNSSCNGDIKIHLSTGDIELNDVTARNLDLKVSTGEIEVENATIENDIKINFSTDDVTLEDVKATNLTINGGTGDVKLDNVIMIGKMNIITSTGNVRFNRSDAGEIKVKVSTGDVRGSLLSSKIFIADTSTGKKQVPKTTEGGLCEITTSTGNIIITIEN